MYDKLGSAPPYLAGPLPGDRSTRLMEALAASECPALTARRARRSEQSGASHDPIVWAEARGSNVRDADGHVFVDLTSGFGVAAVGHRHPRVVAAVHEQTDKLMHALGDLHPSEAKVRLLERLAELAPWPDARVILGLTGSDAIEAALKTAALATGRPGILAFEGAYHGLSHGPLAACGYSEGFRAPFASQLNPHVTFAPYPDGTSEGGASVEQALGAVERAWPKKNPGCVLVEPILGRGGVVIPPPGFLAGLAKLAKSRGALLIVDEILTGMGRTGTLLRSVTDGVQADLICVGKALGGGLPVSACLGHPETMAAWGDPTGEALHTGTFFGHPLGCAAAVATLDVITEERLCERSASTGRRLLTALRAVQARHPQIRALRGEGLLIGIDFSSGAATLKLVRRLLEMGYLTLPAGRTAETLQIAPPLCIEQALLDGFLDALDHALQDGLG